MTRVTISRHYARLDLRQFVASAKGAPGVVLLHELQEFLTDPRLRLAIVAQRQDKIRINCC
jgi:hypothetical protein